MVKYECIALCSSCKTLGARPKTTGAPEQESRTVLGPSLLEGIGALMSADCAQAFAAEHRGQRLGWVRVGEDSSPHRSHGEGAPPHACSGVQAPNAEGPRIQGGRGGGTRGRGRACGERDEQYRPRRRRHCARLGRKVTTGNPKHEKTRVIARLSHKARSPLRCRRLGLSLMEPCSARDYTPSEVSALGCKPG
jgi:hypothetical protein